MCVLSEVRCCGVFVCFVFVCLAVCLFVSVWYFCQLLLLLFYHYFLTLYIFIYLTTIFHVASLVRADGCYGAVCALFV